MPPTANTFRPVAVTMMSAASSSPEARRRPFGVKRSMRSVTMDARPLCNALNRSPSGTKHMRWSHGSYVGAKWVSTSYPSGTWASTPLRSNAFMTLGARRDSWNASMAVSTFFQRSAGNNNRAGTLPISLSAMTSLPGREST
jgi:hypothetical protein